MSEYYKKIEQTPKKEEKNYLKELEKILIEKYGGVMSLSASVRPSTCGCNYVYSGTPGI